MSQFIVITEPVNSKDSRYHVVAMSANSDTGLVFATCKDGYYASLVQRALTLHQQLENREKFVVDYDPACEIPL